VTDSDLTLVGTLSGCGGLGLKNGSDLSVPDLRGSERERAERRHKRQSVAAATHC
jgi:hypothetical protein